MSVVNAAVEAVIEWLNGKLNLFATVTRGALPTGCGITCEVGPSRPERVFLDKGQYIPLDLVFNAKHRDLEIVTNALNDIHGALTMARSYPRGDGWEIVDITTYTLPEVIGREDEGGWLLASSLAVKLSWEGIE